MLAGFVVWTVVWNLRERGRQKRLAETRPPLTAEDFVDALAAFGVNSSVARFVWGEFQTYYFKPLTPHPNDRPISEFGVDPDDLSDMVRAFEKQFGRNWIGDWVGAGDPTLAEFAQSLIASTTVQ